MNIIMPLESRESAKEPLISLRAITWSILCLLVLFSLSCADRHPLLLSSSPALDEHSSIRGRILDPEQQPVIGAEVTLSSFESGKKLSTSTEIDGTFDMHWVPIGTYTIEIRAPGYKTIRRKAISVPKTSSVRVEAVLPPSVFIAGIVDPPGPIDYKSTSIGIAVYNDDTGLPRIEMK